MASASPLQIPWLVTRYARIVAGHGVLIWKAGDQVGIYAIAQIIEPPKMIASPPDIGYWIDASCVGFKPCAKIRFTSKLSEYTLLNGNMISPDFG
ncbi:hypothetical protein [Nostoc parmelioides]|uniref:EVE domain-containing protein n=1 Tax=Nostoc parmelioides FACHB-3921 TaxID=2692909 RepID=A0ABR8BPP9_9NOSO|nr:hypothetical protein [Nostoc parmelioides]MBD2255841.1 hypothetical protein [Nostoc parmelioides FACHB-3921]